MCFIPLYINYSQVRLKKKIIL